MLLQEIKGEIRHICYKLSYIKTNEADGQTDELLDFNVSFIDSLNNNLGDISCNVSMILSKRLNKSPVEIAEEIKNLLLENKNYEKVEIKNNFINITLGEDFLKNKIKALQENNYEYKLADNKYTGKNILVEYTDPNPFKIFHIGHLMANAIGDSIARILEDYGANIKRINYGGDIGLHVAKSLYGMLRDNEKEVDELYDAYYTIFINNGYQDFVSWKLISLREDLSFDFGDTRVDDIINTVNLLISSYSKIHAEYESDNNVQLEVKELNRKLYNLVGEYIKDDDFNHNKVDDFLNQNREVKETKKGDFKILILYLVGKKLCNKYFQDIYKILGSTFDKQIWESECAEIGERKVRENLKDENSPNGIFEYGDEQNGKRPIIYNGERVGLHNRVFINSEGLTTYEAKDIGNFETKLKYCEENNFPIDDSYSIVITANEQDAYFKVLYSALGELYKDKNIHNEHYSHGMMRFADGKMSSRKGNVIGGMDLINEVKDKLKEINPEQTEEERQSWAVSAIKYSILKQTIGKDIIFDRDKVISTSGDSGIYLQYCRNRFSKLAVKHDYNVLNNLSETDRLLLTHILKLPDIYNDTLKDFSINKIVTYDIELARLANSFYESSKDERIIGNKKNELLSHLIVNNFKKCFKTLGFSKTEE